MTDTPTDPSSFYRRLRGLSLAARQALRLENAKPLLDGIRKQIETA